jgi:hypothetical protein
MMIDSSLSEKKTETEELFVLKSHQQAHESRIFSLTIDSLIYRSVSFAQEEDVPVIPVDVPVQVQSPIEEMARLRALSIPNAREGDLLDSPLSSSSPGKVSGKRKKRNSENDPSTKRRKSSRKHRD